MNKDHSKYLYDPFMVYDQSTGRIMEDPMNIYDFDEFSENPLTDIFLSQNMIQNLENNITNEVSQEKYEGLRSLSWWGIRIDDNLINELKSKQNQYFHHERMRKEIIEIQRQKLLEIQRNIELQHEKELQVEIQRQKDIELRENQQKERLMKEKETLRLKRQQHLHQQRQRDDLLRPEVDRDHDIDHDDHDEDHPHVIPHLQIPESSENSNQSRQNISESMTTNNRYNNNRMNGKRSRSPIFRNIMDKNMYNQKIQRQYDEFGRDRSYNSFNNSRSSREDEETRASSDKPTEYENYHDIPAHDYNRELFVSNYIDYRQVNRRDNTVTGRDIQNRSPYTFRDPHLDTDRRENRNRESHLRNGNTPTMIKTSESRLDSFNRDSLRDYRTNKLTDIEVYQEQYNNNQSGYNDRRVQKQYDNNTETDRDHYYNRDVALPDKFNNTGNILLSRKGATSDEYEYFESYDKGSIDDRRLHDERKRLKDGHKGGHRDGHRDSHRDGHRDGYKGGHRDGHKDGGYRDGHKDGYRDGRGHPHRDHKNKHRNKDQHTREVDNRSIVNDVDNHLDRYDPSSHSHSHSHRDRDRKR